MARDRNGRREALEGRERVIGPWEPSSAGGSHLLHPPLPTAQWPGADVQSAAGRGRGGSGRGRGAGRGGGAHLQVKTSVRSLHVLHLTKQHQWNLQLHCQTLVYWWVL